MKINLFYTLIYFLTCLSMTVFADVKVNSLFTNKMVLQRHQEVLIYGSAAEGESISVSFNG
jgi:hypothetical protein